MFYSASAFEVLPPLPLCLAFLMPPNGLQRESESCIVWFRINVAPSPSRYFERCMYSVWDKGILSYYSLGDQVMPLNSVGIGVVRPSLSYLLLCNSTEPCSWRRRRAFIHYHCMQIVLFLYCTDILRYTRSFRWTRAHNILPQQVCWPGTMAKAAGASVLGRFRFQCL